MTTFSITPLTRDQFEAARTRLASQGIIIAGDEGDIESHKVGTRFVYNGTDTLTITIKHEPWYATASEVEEKIRKWFATNA